MRTAETRPYMKLKLELNNELIDYYYLKTSKKMSVINIIFISVSISSFNTSQLNKYV